MDEASKPTIQPEFISERLGAFDEIEFLGKGSFGETFRVARGDDEFALKIITFPDMPAHLWEREIAALKRVEHPNVVAFRESGGLSANGYELPYLACEYVSGGDVAKKIAAGNRPISPQDVRAFLTGLLAGAGEIHDLGILHRDIKPANVALRDGQWGLPVLLDFGLARVLDMSSHTEYPAHIGTAAYMAPEQLRGSPARRRSDLYAVGAVVYEAGIGTHPYRTAETATIQSLHDRIKSGPPRDPREVSETFPDDVARVVMRLLSYWGHERLGISEAMKDLEAG
ncbi:MAG: serine/threonine protein kinase [Actinomycetota bacterium]